MCCFEAIEDYSTMFQIFKNNTQNNPHKQIFFSGKLLPAYGLNSSLISLQFIRASWSTLHRIIDVFHILNVQMPKENANSSLKEMRIFA